MYGSMATGLAIDSSDMDLLISGVFINLQEQRPKYLQGYGPLNIVDRPLLVDQMKRLYRELTNIETTCTDLSSLKDCLDNI